MIINQANLQTFFKGLETVFNNAFAGQEPQWSQIATLIPSGTASEDYGWLGDFPELRKWIGDRVLQNMQAHNYTIKNEPFESTVPISRDRLEDDQYGVYNPLVGSMGEASAQHPDKLVFDLLADGDSENCYDRKSFFNANHPNGKKGTASNIDSSGSGKYWYLLDTSRMLKPLIFQRRRDYRPRVLNDLNDSRVFMANEFLYGVDARVNVGFGFWQMAYASNKTLNGANFEAAEKAMMGYKSDNGRPLGVSPNIVVVGASNAADARKTFNIDRLDGGAGNPNYHAVNILKTSRLA